MRDGMNDGSPPQDPNPDHPESEPWARDPGALRGFEPALELPGMPEVSADFVDRTWQRIREDRRQVAAEAARVDESPLPASLLDAYQAPEPSDDFVARTLDRMRSDRIGATDFPLRNALDAYRTPADHHGRHTDFVERTLFALRLERTRIRLVDDSRAEARPHSSEATARAPVTPRRWSLLALAATLLAAVALGLSGLWSGPGAGPEPNPPRDVVVQFEPPTRIPPTAEDFTPTPIGTAVARGDEGVEIGARLGQADGLLLFAALAAGER